MSRPPLVVLLVFGVPLVLLWVQGIGFALSVAFQGHHPGELMALAPAVGATTLLLGLWPHQQDRQEAPA